MKKPHSFLELDEVDVLSMHISRALGIVDTVRGSCLGEVLDAKSPGIALTSAFEHLEEAKQLVTKASNRGMVEAEELHVVK